MGAIVELGRVRPTPERPELEDHEFSVTAAKRAGYVSAERLWQVLDQTALGTLAEIFGDDLEHAGTRAFLPLGVGAASLGCYRPIGPVDLVLRDDHDHKSVRVVLPAERLDLSLTDARYFRNEFSQPDEERIGAAQDALKAGTGVLLGVGVGRPFASSEGQPAAHWLQVNAIHLAHNPGLRLRTGRS